MITMRNIIGLLRSPHIFHNSSFPIGRFTALNAVLLCMLASQCIFLFVPNTCYSQDQVVLFREEFDNLDNWKHVFLSKTKTPTKYSIEVNHEDHHLKAESNASASALLHQTEFNVYEYPNVRWQWMIMNVYQQGDTRTKTGDNSPLRIYVLFEYQPDTFDGFEKAIYDIAKLLHGEYPPYAALCYFWDNQPTDKKRISTSPNVDRVKMIVLQGGTGKIGTWQEEQINIVEDYLKAFGKKPPPMAKIGIMNDSDFTGERSISYLRFLEVYR